TGEAGAGKTALVTEFARRAQDSYADLLVAIGNCNAQTGIGDPYLPFREVLGLLTGDVEAKLTQGAITQANAGRLRNFLHVSGEALVDLGPDLIDIFVPGSGLATRAGAFLAGKVGWLDRLQELTARKAARGASADLQQKRIFEQYTNVLQALAAQQPLMLVVDDLQWADTASIGLLFHLGRRIGESRILIVGAYRPDDVALGRGGERHPLEPMVNELKRYFGDVWVGLEQTQVAEGRQFVVREQGRQQVGEQRLYLYRFRHSLFQQHLYNGLGEIERELLHGEIAAVLEELHQGRTDEIAVQLAHHWVRAEEDKKAAGYMLTAGDQARTLYANAEAEQFYQAAVKILRQQGQDELAARTLMKLGLVYTAAFEPEKARRAYDDAFTLWKPLREDRELSVSPLAPAVLRVAVGEPVSLSPGKAYDSDSFFLQAQLFEGLVEIDLDQNVLPAIAAHWEVADGSTKYVFYLREGTRWSDGTPVTAGQFEYAWKRNLDPATNSPAAHLL
ncbi:MAG: AAA family ATPase, partial [Anaerolineae bacterium]